MSWLLQKIVHNEAMKSDPKEIYGWRVFMLACSVRISSRLTPVHFLIYPGLLWRHVVWHGLRHHWRSSDDAPIQGVCSPNKIDIQSCTNSLSLESKYGLQTLDKVGQANLSANIVSTLQAGCFFGALIASPIAERWGRRLSLIGAALVGIVGVIMQTAASGHLEAMYIGRYGQSPQHAWLV